MTTQSKDDVLRIARECGFDGINPMGFFITDTRAEIIERFAAAMYAAGAADMREMAVMAGDAACDAINVDSFSPTPFHSSCNDWGDGVIAGAGAYRDAIRALPITPANTER